MLVHGTTALFLFELDQCVEHVFYESIYTRYKKFEYFVVSCIIVCFLRQNCITNKSDAANTLYKIYDKNSIIECELIVNDLDYIVHTALHDK